MKLISVTRAARARLGAFAAGMAVAVGAGMQWSAGVGLMVGGALAAAFFLGLYDVDEERRR